MRVLYVTGVIIILDQLTKLLVKGFTVPFLDFYHSGMQLGASVPILGDFLRLTFIENPGMAFGIDIGGRLFLTIFSVIASIGILVYLYRIREESLAVRAPLAMILGGAIGNLIDRIFYGVVFGEGSLFYGKVVDFIDVDFFNIEFASFHISRWPVFNIADASVSTGVLILLVFHRKFTNVEEPRVSLASTSETAGSSDGMKNGSSEALGDRSSPSSS
ncbi:MAG TPA: signal peptidase II [Bacteroidota bacterium]|nr:signal peptidase II [Bacteroidota bacterium]